jgi:hypothetical protein
MSNRLIPILVLAGLLGGATAGGEAGFARKPTAAKDGGKTVIEFAAAAPADCAVYVLDAGGRVVRHLAAGVLGEKAPAPLKPGLAQSLVWDGRDDFGRPAAGGPFKVRVGLGLTPEFDKILGGRPEAIGDVRGLAVGPGGELYVLHIRGAVHPCDNTLLCSVFSRDGKYLRQVIPYPASLPEEKLTGLRRIDRGNGHRVPFIYHLENRAFLPGGGEPPGHSRPVVTRDGRFALVGVRAILKSYAHAGVSQLVVLGTDGSAPGKSVLGPVINEKADTASLALSPDEKTVYAAGVRVTDKLKSKHAVYKFGWDDRKASVFVGQEDTPGSDGRHLSEPMSVAVGGDGNVYVADRGNNRIAVFRPDGSFLGKIDVERPERVEVHPGTGAVYVLGGPQVGVLRKYSSWKEGNLVAEAKVPSFKHKRYTATLALDASARPPVVWVAAGSRYARFALLRIEDQGDAFGDQARFPAPGETLGRCFDVHVLPDDSAVYVGVRGNKGGPIQFARVDPAGGEVKACGIRVPKTYAVHRMSLGRDGMFYFDLGGKARGYHRLDRAFKPVPYPGADQGYLPLYGGRLRSRGVTAGYDGKAYVFWQKNQETGKGPSSGEQANILAVYGPDGKLVNKKLIDSDIRSVNSVRVDPAGNIYVLAGVAPGASPVPPGLEGQIPDGRKDPGADAGVNGYPVMYGSVIKFGPAGGEIKKGSGGVECNYSFGLAKLEVKGAEWIVPGASPVPSCAGYPTPGYLSICMCESPSMGVDGFGRCFFPDALRFRVGVLDTAGNPITHFGSYGNQDSAGPGSTLPEPRIPFTWIAGIGLNDRAVYVGDRLSQRLVRVRLTYAADQTVPVN